MARVIISSGHSTANPGSIANGLREVDLARLIAKATLRHLRFNGIISLSVPPEMELLQRIEWINHSGYQAQTSDVAIEIHINDGGKSGIEAWYEGDGMNASQQLTELILAGAVETSKLQNQGAKSEYKHEIGSISFIHETVTISSLIECGYIDNQHDAEFLKNPANIDLLGKGIAKGICKFLNVEFREMPQQAAVVQQAPQPQSMQQPIVQQQPPAAMQPSAQQPVQQVAAFNNNSGFAQPAPAASTQPAYQPVQTMNPIPPSYQQPTVPVQTNQPVPTPPAALASQTNTNNAFQPLPSRDERKKMIGATYQSILGREPSQNDLNYFLNIGIREDELVKKMLSSQEHVDLVKSKQELNEIKQTYTQQKTELEQIRTAYEDQKRIIEGLNYSILQKNTALANYQQYFAQIQASAHKPGQNPVAAPQQPVTNYKGTFLDRLFKAFSDLFE
jgi:N-acetylmuramoyl-L-alanine amidase